MTSTPQVPIYTLPTASLHPPPYQNMSLPAEYPSIASTLPTQNQPLWEWSARVRFNKHELGSSFTVCLFLGEPPKNPEEWLTASNFAGAHHAFVAGGGYGRRRGPGGDTGEGFVNLNSAIVRLSKLNTLDPEAIEPYLKSELQWRVQKTDTTPAELQSLEIVVFATPLTYPPGSMFPVPGERRRYSSITFGKKGGCREEDLGGI
ncbi:hypothetical protein CVT25_005465 [Psilocybe cyanescens]|uniref:Tyrosinase C-terminal domain-containing protein n=1 Tax=Psilocybe cyanescens TaxID=93625 RepID=A0A409XS02_PSICY|nr:hypothetical protein CVT25_005465 [Psilocybe cyanescens]